MEDQNNGYTIDEAVDLLNGVQSEPEQEEQQQEQQQVNDNDNRDGQEDGPSADDPGQKEQEQQQQQQAEQQQNNQPDFSQRIKFKDNGQEVELTVAQLIERAQKGSNYERHMQDLAAKQKAFEASLQQPKQPEKPVSPAEEWEKRLQEEEARNPNFNRFDPAQTLSLMERTIREERQKEFDRQSQETQLRDWQAQDQRYSSLIEENWKDPGAEKFNEFAVQQFYALPQKGAEGVAEFQKLYPIYQKIQQRDALWRGEQVKLDPFTAQEIDLITDFFKRTKSEYQSKQQKEQVKAQVPKNPPIKPTVKLESSGGDSAPAPKPDFKKMRNMSIDDIAKML